MGFFNDLVPGLSDLNSAANASGGNLRSIEETQLDLIYTIDDTKWHNWYRLMPYTFQYRTKDGFDEFFHLPIAPSNLQITTHFATNIIPTMYGTIEEHSEQRYFDITISGTTGIAPKYFQSSSEIDTDLPAPGRRSFEIVESLSQKTGGFAGRTAELVQGTLNSAASLGQDLSIIGSPGETSGVNERASGYVAFHNFYRFLLKYKQEVSADDNNQSRKSSKTENNHPLQFINNKDNNQYNVAIQTFQLTRSADDPMLYNYSIVMRGYRLTTANEKYTDYDELRSDLGLDGVDSVSWFARMSNAVRKAKNVAYSTVAAVKGFGG